VTVSIGDDMIGVFNEIFFVNDDVKSYTHINADTQHELSLRTTGKVLW